MWPFARGSLQPKRQPSEIIFHIKSQSAPQLSVAVPHKPVHRVLAEPGASHKPPPPCSLTPLLSDPQLITLSRLPTDEALELLTVSLSEHIPEPNRGSVALLLYSVYQWAQNQHLDTHQISVLLSIYNDTAKFCLDSPWRTQQEVYQFFRESLLNRCVDRSPYSTYVYSPEQCRAVLLLFCLRFLLVLPLLRLTSLPNQRLTLTWDLPDEIKIAS